MLDKQDLGQIRDLLREEFASEQFRGTIYEVVGEALEQVVLPRLAEHDERFEAIESRLGGVESRLGRIEANMVTRDFLEERLANFRLSLTDSADWVGRQLKRLTSELHNGDLLTAKQVIEIHAR